MSSPDTDAPAETRTFSDFGVHTALCEALNDAGITDPFPIQELTLPMALAGADVIGQARTGTGKTLAFGLPALQRLDTTQHRIQALVIVPTRELCLQVTDDLEKAGAKLGVSVVALYGGRPIPPQAQALAAGAHVAVGTPGRLLDLHQRGILDLSHVGTLVLDEADEMLDLGFLPDVERLIEFCPTRRQTLLFSATMPSPVVKLARRYMSQPTFLRAEDDRSDLSPDTTHYFFSCHRLDKPALLARILQTPERGLCVVFTRTKRMADQLATELNERDVDAAAIHSDLRQEARERAMQRFREGKVTVLVATEVAARGLDIDDVTHVVNYDCPDDEKMYLHRIGRTGRAGAAGAAITLAVWNELARLEMIKKALGLSDEPTHEVFSTSELVDEMFELPPRQSRARTASTGSSSGSGSGADQTRAAGGGKPRSGSKPASSGNRGGGGGGGNQQRRRGKRGGRDRSQGGDRDRSQSSDRPAAGSRAPTDSDGDGDTRSGADTGPSGDDAAGGEAAPSSAPAASDGGGSARTRQRTRTRTRTSAPSGQPGGQAAASDAPSIAPTPAASGGDASGGDQADGRRSTGKRSGAKRRGGQRSGGQRGGGQRSGGQRSGGQRSGGQSDGGQRSGGQGDGGQRDDGKREGGGQRRGGKPQGDRSGRRRPVVSASVARGDGRPLIRRPLQVQHLP